MNLKLFKIHTKKFILFLAFTLLIFDIIQLKVFHNKIYDFLITTYSIISYPIYWLQDKHSEIINYVYAITQSKNIFLENKRLKEENQNLELIKAENQNLKELLNFQDNFYFTKVTGRVVVESREDFHKQYLLNIGLKNGIQKGNAIVNHNRLIGRIIDVSGKSSKIQLLTDESSKISVTILNTNYYGVAAGIYNDEYLKLLYLSSDLEIEDNQIVVTSGEGGYVPYGIYVGQIIKRNTEVYIKINTEYTKKLGLVSVLKLKGGFADANSKK